MKRRSSSSPSEALLRRAWMAAEGAMRASLLVPSRGWIPLGTKWRKEKPMYLVAMREVYRVIEEAIERKNGTRARVKKRNPRRPPPPKRKARLVQPPG